MFKKLITTLALTLALGATFCTKPAFAVGVKDNSYCENTPDTQANRCDPGWAGTPCEYGVFPTTEGGHLSVAVSYEGPNPYVDTCGTATGDSHCCTKTVNCYWSGGAVVYGNHSASYMCALATRDRQTNMRNNDKTHLSRYEDCYTGGTVNGKSCD